jgi:multidrug resistance protein, MATE family
VLYMTPLSIGVACSTLVSQALGAQRFDEARSLARHGIVMACCIALIYGAIMLALRPLVLAAYTPNAQVVAAAMPLVLIVVFYHLCDALQITTAFVLRAYKVAVIPTIIYAVALWGIGLGGGYFLGFDVPGSIPEWSQGARGFWIANTASLGVAGVGLFLYFRRVSRKFTQAMQ